MFWFIENMCPLTKPLGSFPQLKGIMLEKNSYRLNGKLFHISWKHFLWSIPLSLSADKLICKSDFKSNSLQNWWTFAVDTKINTSKSYINWSYRFFNFGKNMYFSFACDKFNWDCYTHMCVSNMVATCGYWGLDMWLVQIHMCYSYNTHARFQRLSIRKWLTYLLKVNNFLYLL